MNVAIAKPTTNLEDNPTLVFTMWDIISDKSYIVDLGITVREFKSKPVNFNFNIIDIIQEATGDKIDSVRNFRWGVVGGYASRQEIGYVGSYPASVTPVDVRANIVSQRLQRLKYYLKDQTYTGKPRKVAGKDISKPSHYLDLWEGNFDGLSKEKLEGRGGGESMVLWSYFAVDRAKIIKQVLGKIHLDSNGQLEFLMEKQ
jgi:hypothetical protein